MLSEWLEHFKRRMLFVCIAMGMVVLILKKFAVNNMDRLSNWFRFDFHQQLIKLADSH